MGTQFSRLQKGAQRPLEFAAHVYCGQTAGWIKIPLGIEVGLGPGHIVLDGDPVPPQKGAQPSPIFVPCLLWSNGWMDQEFKMPLGTKVGLVPCHIALDVKPAHPPKGVHPPIFGRCLLWPNARPSQLLLSTCCIVHRRQSV